MKYLFAVTLLMLAFADSPSPLIKDTLPAELLFDPLPLGLKNLPVPSDNPMTLEKVQLGRKLFFDPILSADKTVSCATCHSPEKSFAGPETFPKGINGQATKRKPPALINRGFGQAMFWDGRAKSLEEQALQPIEDPTEMGSTLGEVIERLKKDEGYRAMFAKAFPKEEITSANLAKAIASFERALLAGQSAVDKFSQKGERSALTQQQLHGFWLYESKGMCWKCHSGQNFSDESFHNTGVSWGKNDLGRYAITKTEGDQGKFKTPTLRGVNVSGPYMHDGSLKTLEDVVEFYNKGGQANPHLDAAMKPLNLTAEEKQALVEFLKVN